MTNLNYSPDHKEPAAKKVGGSIYQETREEGDMQTFTFKKLGDKL